MKTFGEMLEDKSLCPIEKFSNNVPEAYGLAHALLRFKEKEADQRLAESPLHLVLSRLDNVPNTN